MQILQKSVYIFQFHYFYQVLFILISMTQKILILINDAPYGTEKAYNGLRLAMQLQKDYENIDLCVFLMADAVTCALPSQNTPNGYYNIERMLKAVLLKKGKVKLCGSCSEARGIKGMKLVEGAELSTMKELTQLTIESDKVITF
jgi:uncharacterized protein involved in oxidation of intracellular sulfur